MKAWLRWVAMGAACCSVASAREWTSVSGTKLEADFVRLTGDMVTLKKPDGQTIGIRRQLLSAEDQAFLQEQSGAPAAGQPIALTGLSSRPSLNTSIVLTDAQLAELKPEFTDEKNGNKYQFVVSAALDKTSSKNRNWKEGKGLDVKITASCYKAKDVGGGKVARTLETGGSCHFYILDEAGKPALTKSKSLDSMCPT
jgi:hypothetical protein